MHAFAELFQTLDRARGTNAKVSAMAAYFSQASAADGAWAVYFLSGRRIKRLIGPTRLREWLAEATGLPDWLVTETHEHVGDLAETIALMLPEGVEQADDQRGLAEWVEAEILSLRDCERRNASRG